MSWTITPKMLKDHGACQKQYQEFCRLWPKGMIVTKKNLRMMAKAWFNCADWEWAAEWLISSDAKTYCSDKIEREIDGDCNGDCVECEMAIDAFYATVKKFRSV